MYKKRSILRIFADVYRRFAKNSGNNTVHFLQLVLSVGLEQRQKIVKPLVDTLLDSAEELLKDELPRALRGANTDFEVPADEFDDIFYHLQRVGTGEVLADFFSRICSTLFATF